MIAAIYARKSTDQNGVADDQRSVRRQVDHARQYAARKGWTVDDASVFVDDGVSGAEFTKRPGLLRLMNALKPRPPFQVLVMSEESRLGREAIETAYALKQIVTAGVRVFFYLEDRERTLDSPTDKIMMSLTAFADELEREKARQRTSDAMVRKARAGHVCGGSCFGYANVDVAGADGNRSHVERQIVSEQAAVIVRIFEECASGHGVKAITKALNADGVPSPRPQQGRSQSWAPSSVREALFRRTYRGEIVWNKTKKRNQWGQQHQQDRPSDDWITVPAPHLRIVSDDLWNRAHARLDAARATYLVAQRGDRWGRPPTGLVSKYLLTGLTRCATCGGSMASHTRSHGSSRGRWRVPVYVCSSYANRGPSVCGNGMPLPMLRADRAVLEKFREVVLDPDIVAGAIEDAIQALRPADDDALAGRRRALTAELQQIEAQLASYAQAIATVGAIPAVTAALKERETQRLRLNEQLAALDAARTEARRPFSATRLRKDLRRRMDDWRALLVRQTPQAREILRKLIDGRLVFTAHPDEQVYRFKGTATLGHLLAGLVVVGDGGEPDDRNGNGHRSASPLVWRPQRDSNPCFGLERATSWASGRWGRREVRG